MCRLRSNWDAGHLDGWIAYEGNQPVAELEFVRGEDEHIYLFRIAPLGQGAERLQTLSSIGRAANPMVSYKNRRTGTIVSEPQFCATLRDPDHLSIRDFRSPPTKLGPWRAVHLGLRFLTQSIVRRDDQP